MDAYVNSRAHLPIACLSGCLHRFGDDGPAGHGTHVASSAAGSTLNNPAETITCDAGTTLGCAGGCIDTSYLTDDLVSYTSQTNVPDLDRMCPLFGCPDDDDNPFCLGEDVGVTLAENGGMAQGAKIAFFDIVDDDGTFGGVPGNGLWEPCREAGCKIHSNSWGGLICATQAMDIEYDSFMYNNPENLLVWAAGNSGEDVGQECTIESEATAKNVLTVGASSSGETRLTGYFEAQTDDIDVVASFSSYGPAPDGRIKPDLVAPGDSVSTLALRRTTIM